MLYFEELEIGEVGRSTLFELVETDAVAFAQQWDPQPFHVDKAATRESVYGGLTASGCHLVCISNLLYKQFERWAIMGLLGQTFQYPTPARPGDRLTLTAAIVDRRASTSKLDRGIITVRATLKNQDGDAVLLEESTVMVQKGRLTHGDIRIADPVRSALRERTEQWRSLSLMTKDHAWLKQSIQFPIR